MNQNYEYFKYKYIGGEHTLYRKIKKVKKGNLMKISFFDGKIKKRNFIQLIRKSFIILILILKIFIMN